MFAAAWLGCEGKIGDAPALDDAGVTVVVDAGHAEDAGGVDAGAPGADAGLPDAGPVDAGAPDAGVIDAGTPDAGTPDAGQPDAGSPCGAAKFCERFDGYDAGRLTNNTTLGPWSVRVQDAQGTVSIDRTHVFSGSNALKVHINAGSSSGGQLRTRATPLFAMPRAQLYGRFMMYLQGGAGTSVHWTMFGAAGNVPSGPTSGHHATYLFSAFQAGMNNRFGDVYYDDQTAQDCWHHSTQLLPVDRWACVSFSVDGAAIAYRMGLDGQAVPSMSVDTTGDGCVAHPGATPWYGPRFDEFYVGALSFHAMSASLDLWVDDVVLDTSPVACP